MWEQRLRVGRRGKQVRPFVAQAGIGARQCSLPLQRALTDFGAEDSFMKAAQRVREHYGVEVSASAARQHTLAHARVMGRVEHERPSQPVKDLIAQLDGCMLPLVESAAQGQADRRKGKQLSWQEARLCCARDHDKAQGVYGATFGTVSLTGLLWREVADAAGLGEGTQVHGLGDGAPWILGTFEDQFGAGPDARATYTIDFHHVSDYLAAAAQVVAPQHNQEWLHRQQEHLLNNHAAQVLRNLKKHREAPEQKEAPVRSAYNYIHERQEHMDYAGARARGLPIGSGEVESGHRHVLQKRLKIAGAWWLKPHAQAMLQLRTVRANRDWEKYWAQIAAN